MSTPESNPNSTDWSPCPAGTLGSLSGRLRADQTRRNARKAAGAAASVAVVALLLVNLMPAAKPAVFNPGGITCSECVAQMPDYSLHLLAKIEMTPKGADAMAEHLANCPKCRGHFESKYPGVLVTAVSAGFGLMPFVLLGARRAR